MLLAIDVGNTNTVFGLFDKDALIRQWRASSDKSRTSDEWSALIAMFLRENLSVLEEVIIGSVVPSVTSPLRQALMSFAVDPVVLSASSNHGLEIAIDIPEELGPDRIANSVAAYEIYSGPVVVVDMGTATAFDVVSKDGVFVGGIILPGVETSLSALFQKASALKWVDISVPREVIGKNTKDAVRSGATFGFAAQVDGVVEKIFESIGSCAVVATGGFANIIAPLLKRVQTHDAELTLKGLQIINERIKG